MAAASTSDVSGLEKIDYFSNSSGVFFFSAGWMVGLACRLQFDRVFVSCFRLQRRLRLSVSAAKGETQVDSMDRATFLGRTAVASVAAATGGLAASSGLQPSLAAEVMGTSYGGEHENDSSVKCTLQTLNDSFLNCPVLYGTSDQLELCIVAQRA